ncbi:MAG: helix-turn-helix domain-containing protein [Dehalococcoidia bacterium]
MGNGEHMSEMLTVREVARIFHIHPNTLRRWSNNGTIDAYRINQRGDRRFKREDIVRFLAEMNSYVDDRQGTESRQQAVVTVVNKSSTSSAGATVRNRIRRSPL